MGGPPPGYFVSQIDWVTSKQKLGIRMDKRTNKDLTTLENGLLSGDFGSIGLILERKKSALRTILFSEGKVGFWGLISPIIE